MRQVGLAAAATATIVLAAALASGGGAQPRSARDLAMLGDNHWKNGRCLDAAMNYYALLQQPAEVLGNNGPRLENRIRLCRRVLANVGTAGIDAKADRVGRPPDGDASPVVLPPARVPASATDPATPEMTEGDNPADPPRIRVCRSYARAAVQQMRMLRNAQCDLQSLRTRSSEYSFHYDWCTQRAAPLAVQNEANSRARALNACLLRW